MYLFACICHNYIPCLLTGPVSITCLSVEAVTISEVAYVPCLVPVYVLQLSMLLSSKTHYNFNDLVFGVELLSKYVALCVVDVNIFREGLVLNYGVVF